MLLGSGYMLQAQTVTTIDFTDPATPTWGTNAQMNVGGVMMLIPGDANGDGEVKYNGGLSDREKILQTVGFFTPNNIVSGYYVEDVNLDGEVKYNGGLSDRERVLQTVGFFTPNNIVVEQIP